MNQIQKVLVDLIDTFDELKIQYMLMGGLALQRWTVPRATFDIDATVLIDDDSKKALIQKLNDKGFDIPEVYTKGFLDSLRGMNLFKVQWFLEGFTRPLMVDLFVVTLPYQQEAMKRRVTLDALGRAINIMSAEDLILHKLMANSEKDILDVKDIIRDNADLDTAYLKKWASELGLKKELGRFIH